MDFLLSTYFYEQNFNPKPCCMKSSQLLEGNSSLAALVHKDLTKVQTHSVYHTSLKPETLQNELLTCNFQFVTSDFSLQINPSSLLCVVHATEAWDIYHTLLVNVHVTGCGHKNGSDTHQKLKL